MQTNPTDRARRVQAAADDWSEADPEMKDAVEEGVIVDFEMTGGVFEHMDSAPVVAPGTFWPALIVCVCMLGRLAVYAYRQTF